LRSTEEVIHYQNGSFVEKVTMSQEWKPRIVVLGEKRVGKSFYIIKFVVGTFYPEDEPNFEEENLFTKSFIQDGESVEVEIWDDGED
jgi:GTPase SAR1 family protein